MNYKVTLSLLVGLFLATSATAQRMIGGAGITLDDGASHTLTIVPPSISSNYVWQLPLPPSGAPQQSGFVPAGTVIGQTLTWNGTQWIASSGSSSPFSFVRKTASTNYTTTSLTNDPDLMVSLSANSTYTFEAYLSFADVSGGSPKIAFTTPIGSTITYGFTDALGVGSTSIATVMVGSGTSSPLLEIYNDGSGTNKTLVIVRGMTITGATSGNLQLQVSEFGGSISLAANSHLLLTKVQ